jgi:hypothetical protein
MMAPSILAVEPRTQPQKVRCDCCSTPVAEVRGTDLVIRSKHMGEIHITKLSIVRLIELLERAA